MFVLDIDRKFLDGNEGYKGGDDQRLEFPNIVGNLFYIQKAIMW
jgi:hypothetical protein